MPLSWQAYFWVHYRKKTKRVYGSITQRRIFLRDGAHSRWPLYRHAQDNDIPFHQLCKKDGSRVKYKTVCASCRKVLF